jgi:hypothetical protein
VSSAGPDRAIWTYWEDPPGGTRPAYLDLCLETIRAHSGGMEVRLLARDDAPRWLPDMDADRWRKLPAPNYRSDYLRSRVLQHYGGVWVDIDTIAMSPLSEMLDSIDSSGVVSFGKELGRFFGGLCAARPGAAFVDAWAEEQDRVLSRHEDWSTLGYAALAQEVTWHMARRFPWKALPMTRVAPIPWYEWRRFFSRVESPGAVMAGSPMTIVLWNAVMAPRLRRFDRGDLLSSRMLLARLLRIALGVSDAQSEQDVWTKLEFLSQLRFRRTGQRLETAARRILGRRGPG